MSKHWHLFGASLALWTAAVMLLVIASFSGRIIFASWGVVAGLHAAVTSCWVIARHERQKVEEFCTGSAKGIMHWISKHDAEQDCVPMR